VIATVACLPVVVSRLQIDRFEGYAQTMRFAGLSPRLIEGDGDWASLAAGMLDAPDRPTGVVVHEEPMALTIHLATTQRGLSVPEDLSIAAIAGPDYQPTLVDLTRIGAPANWGRPAVEMLFEKIAEPERELPAKVLPTVFKAGATCAAPREVG